MDALRQIEAALAAEGGTEVVELTQLIAMAESGQPLPPDMVELVVSQLVGIGRQDLARALLMALGVEVPA